VGKRMSIQGISNDEILITETIEYNFKDFKVKSIKKLGEGWMSNAYLINSKWVFRFPKEESGDDDLRKEIMTLPSLKEIITLDIPNFEFIGQQKNGLEFVGYKEIKGKILNHREFSELPINIQNNLALQIANFMNEINLFDISKAKDFSILENDFYRDYSDTIMEFRENVYPVIGKDMQQYITLRLEEYLNNKANFSYTPKLIHADLSIKHLLYNEENEEFTGVIDFGDIQIGDSDFEYTYLLDDCGLDFTKKVMELREEVDITAKLKKVSFFLTVDNVGIILEGIRTNNKAMIYEGIKLLEDEMRINK